MEIAKKHQNKLKEVQENIEQAYLYFKKNNDRYYEFMKFVFQSSLTEDDISTLKSLQKPTIECNILEAYISRLRGEFAKQEPNLQVRAADGVPVQNLTREFTATIDLIEAHLRAIFFDGSNDALEYNIYTDLLAGGFSVAEVYTDYINDMSFEQAIYVDRVFDPTLTGFDPLARESHKGDGRFCFQIFPMTREEFEEKYPNARTGNMSFTRNLEGFNWSYKNEKQDIVLVCDYYFKKTKRLKITKLSNGQVMSLQEYERLIPLWQEKYIEQPPIPVGKPRWTEQTTIERYRLCENEILEYAPTNYKHLPLIFIDGNSVIVRETAQGATEQVTRPFVYHAKGVQKLKNFAFQTMANEIENMEMHKYLSPIEAIPEDYLEDWQDPQHQSTLLYNAFIDGEPDKAIPPPREISRIPTPPIVGEAYQTADQTTQMILGSYDAALGINSNQISGVAIRQGALQSNAAAMPYIMGYIKGLNRIGQIIIDLIPKYYVTPRSIPVVMPDGKRDYQMINATGTPRMNYDPNDLEINVEAGVNFAVQKQVAMEQIERLMQVNQTFAEFMNEYGLEVMLDNLDIRGIDGLKEKALEFMQNQQQQKQQQQQMAMQMNPALLRMKEKEMEIQQQQQKAQLEYIAKTQRTAVDKQSADTDFIKVMSEIEGQNTEQAIKQEQIDAENARTAVDMALSVARHQNEYNKSMNNEKNN